MKSETISQRLEKWVEKLVKEHPKHALLFSPEKRLTPDGRVMCAIKTCDRKIVAFGLCASHNHRIKYASFGLAPDKPICRTQNLSGSQNGNWKGGEISDGHGRVLIYSPNHPNPSYCGTHVYRYRLVMEKHLGRVLKSWEIVHHKNGDMQDDRIENLEVMTQKEHAKLHSSLNGKWAKNYDECVKCHTTTREHRGHGLCNRCAQQKDNK